MRPSKLILRDGVSIAVPGGGSVAVSGLAKAGAQQTTGHLVTISRASDGLRRYGAARIATLPVPISYTDRFRRRRDQGNEADQEVRTVGLGRITTKSPWSPGVAADRHKGKSCLYNGQASSWLAVAGRGSR